jgi:pimeloyl-ACP methyl ester carboxylesterase
VSSLFVPDFCIRCIAESLFFVLLIRRMPTIITTSGIGYNQDHMKYEAPQISKFFGGKRVHYYHNPTAMASEDDLAGYYKDLTQAGTQKLGRITREVNGLVQHLRDALDAVGKQGRVIHLAHSQGALLTFLASKQLLPREMEQIEVLAFGGAAALRSTPQTPFERCVNYYSVNDPLLFVVPAAEQALRSGLVVDREFCFLAPRVGDPIADHHLLGPTYASALAYEGKRFQRHYQSAPYRLARPILVFIVAIVKAILIRFLQLFISLKGQKQLVFGHASAIVETMERLVQRKRLDHPESIIG